MLVTTLVAWRLVSKVHINQAKKLLILPFTLVQRGQPASTFIPSVSEPAERLLPVDGVGGGSGAGTSARVDRLAVGEARGVTVCGVGNGVRLRVGAVDGNNDGIGVGLYVGERVG